MGGKVTVRTYLISH